MFNWFKNQDAKNQEKPKVEEVDEKAAQIKELNETIKSLRKQKLQLEENVESMKFKKRLEQEEVVHINKLERERMKQELDNEKAAIAKKYAEDISTFKEEQRKQLIESLTQFHTKIESRFSEELKNLKEVYGLLMEKLPNVNFAISKHIGEQPPAPGGAALIETTGKGRSKS